MESDNLKAFAAKVRRSWAASKPKRDAAAQRLRQSAEEFSVIVADSASAAAASAKRSWAEGAPARAEAAAQLRRTASETVVAMERGAQQLARAAQAARDARRKARNTIPIRPSVAGRPAGAAKTAAVLRLRQRKGGNRRGGGEERGADYALNLLAYVGTFEGIASARSVCRGWYRILAADARAQDLRRFVARHGCVTPRARRALWLESCRLSPCNVVDAGLRDAYADAARRGQEGEWCEAIDTDVPRTPSVLLAGIERSTLANVLRAVAFRRPDVGYCQGMDYVAAIVLRGLREGGDAEDDAPPRAFAMLACLLARDGMLRGLYTPGFPEVRRRSYALSTLLAATRPELSAHLEKIGACVEVAAFAPWLQTAFGYHAGEAWPYELVARAWDVFLVERHWKVFARLALYVVIVLPDGGPLEEVMPLMQRLEHVKLGADADADASRFVLERALDLKVTRAMLDALGDEFESLTAPAAPASPPPSQPSSPPPPRRVSKPPLHAIPAAPQYSVPPRSNSPPRTDGAPVRRDVRRPSRARVSGPPSPPPFTDL